MTADWFDRARLGLFVHWGHYSAAGWDASWGMVGGVRTLPLVEPVAVAAYHANAANFRPGPNPARDWLRHAKAAGARYAVMGARHHDGFSLWPSRAPGAWGVADVAPSRDLVREYADACAAEGLACGLYYSLSDWRHPAYPPFEERHKPYAWGRNPAPTPDQQAAFRDYLTAQLTELLTDYGRIACLWFDGGWERDASAWGSDAIADLARRLQPGILINDRLPGHGDYQTPEQFVPPAPLPGRWEACMTMNRSWGFNASDRDYKSATALIHALCETAGRGGNLLLNVGPTGDGALPPEQAERLDAIAGWMARYADAIHDTTPGLEPWQFYGPSTAKGDRLFAFLLMRPLERVAIRGLPVHRVAGVRLLGDGQPLRFESRMSVMEELFSPDPRGEILVDVPPDRQDPHASVIEVTVRPEAAAA